MNSNMILKTLATAAILGLLSSPAFAGSLYICAEHTDPDDWQDEWARGPVVIPAGTVFDLAGHVFGTVQDPKDYAHDAGAKGWKVPPAEKERRGKLLLEDMTADQKHKSGIITTHEVKLTKARPCADVSAAAVLSSDWGWTVAPVFGDSTRYYQLYGVIREGKLDTGFDDDANPLNHLATRGQLNAVVRGTITEVIRLPDNDDR